jgi:hypothetical protein
MDREGVPIPSISVSGGLPFHQSKMMPASVHRFNKPPWIDA